MEASSCDEVGIFSPENVGIISPDMTVTAFGDGDRDLTSDMNLARARAAPFVRRLSVIKYYRLDTLVFAAPRLAHPSTLAILCPTDRLPAQASF